MVPTIDYRGKRDGKPSVHALIVGVSEYPDLPRASAPRPHKGAPTYGMRSLTMAAASAAAVFSWLVKNQSYLPEPLGTCRLLLAPSESENAKLKGIAGYKWAAATRSAFVEAAIDWRKDASERAGHHTLFYFAGHGLQLKPHQEVLLFPGFGKTDDEAPILQEGVLLDDILVGMAPSDERKQVAKTQLYFIDACRSKMNEVGRQEKAEPPPLWKMPTVSIDYRDRVVFRATAYGSAAYTIPKDLTVFARALIDCLSGVAGVTDVGKYDPITNEPTWWVTANSLSQALDYKIALLAATYNLHPQQVEPFGKLSNVFIVRLPEAPEFVVKLRAVPRGAEKVAAIRVRDDYEKCVRTYVSPFSEHPIMTVLPGGIYKVEAFGNSPPLHINGRRSLTAKSPFCEWRIPFDIEAP